ncbi:MAG: hypothetical protein KJ706_09740 [Candidatus Omnitrophica bacterium]|nr:hypothetical protein [Candidatus Omnitrophota bacterium]MBU4590484.1 hypothetical protein [Candidatus Omnitrophota bacterium]
MNLMTPVETAGVLHPVKLGGIKYCREDLDKLIEDRRVYLFMMKRPLMSLSQPSLTIRLNALAMEL